MERRAGLYRAAASRKIPGTEFFSVSLGGRINRRVQPANNITKNIGDLFNDATDNSTRKRTQNHAHSTRHTRCSTSHDINIGLTKPLNCHDFIREYFENFASQLTAVAFYVQMHQHPL